MSDVTRLLEAIDVGESKAAEQLLPLVYEELHWLAAARMAQESPGQTLQATALVHEAWLRLAGSDRQIVAGTFSFSDKVTGSKFTFVRSARVEWVRFPLGCLHPFAGGLA